MPLPQYSGGQKSSEDFGFQLHHYFVKSHVSFHTSQPALFFSSPLIQKERGGIVPSKGLNGAGSRNYTDTTDKINWSLLCDQLGAILHLYTDVSPSVKLKVTFFYLTEAHKRDHYLIQQLGDGLDKAFWPTGCAVGVVRGKEHL